MQSGEAVLASFSEMEESVAGFRKILERQASSIDGLIHVLNFGSNSGEAKKRIGERTMEVFTHMIHACGVSIHSILKLTENRTPQIRDCFPICRGIVEAAINAGYVVALGENMAEKAIQHAEQKAFRNLHRTERVGDWSFTVKWMAELDDEVRKTMTAKVRKFNDSHGRSNTWPETSVKDRLLAIQNNLGMKASLNLQFSWFGIYDSSSEIIHGSYYASMFLLGRTQPQANEVENFAHLNNLNHQLDVLECAVFAVIRAFDCLQIRAQLPALAAYNQDVVRTIKELPAIKPLLD